jgi:hypothetical protein
MICSKCGKPFNGLRRNAHLNTLLRIASDEDSVILAHICDVCIENIWHKAECSIHRYIIAYRIPHSKADEELNLENNILDITDI